MYESFGSEEYVYDDDEVNDDILQVCSTTALAVPDCFPRSRPSCIIGSPVR